jgi:hypothetical protein
MIRPCNPLGPVQRIVLDRLNRAGGWRRGGTWVYETPSRTIRILDTLVTRGLAVKGDGYYLATSHDLGERVI